MPTVFTGSNIVGEGLELLLFVKAMRITDYIYIHIYIYILSFIMLLSWRMPCWCTLLVVAVYMHRLCVFLLTALTDVLLIGGWCICSCGFIGPSLTCNTPRSAVSQAIQFNVTTNVLLLCRVGPCKLNQESNCVLWLESEWNLEMDRLYWCCESCIFCFNWKSLTGLPTLKCE